ncbi:hypothetical protein [Streptomyces celluloflavus]|uniref:hypothetical protein n=1 Tax=Streptomyces celluloflavus TaxID=58344 RepID=UPI0036CF0E52
MSHRIAPAPFDVESLIPELAGLGRETTLLYPRSGEPGVRASSIGGPLLWPAIDTIGHGMDMGDLGGM